MKYFDLFHGYAIAQTVTLYRAFRDFYLLMFMEGKVLHVHM